MRSLYVTRLFKSTMPYKISLVSTFRVGDGGKKSCSVLMSRFSHLCWELLWFHSPHDQQYLEVSVCLRCYFLLLLSDVFLFNGWHDFISVWICWSSLKNSSCTLSLVVLLALSLCYIWDGGFFALTCTNMSCIGGRSGIRCEGIEDGRFCSIYLSQNLYLCPCLIILERCW